MRPYSPTTISWEHGGHKVIELVDPLKVQSGNLRTLVESGESVCRQPWLDRMASSDKNAIWIAPRRSAPVLRPNIRYDGLSDKCGLIDALTPKTRKKLQNWIPRMVRLRFREQSSVVLMSVPLNLESTR